MIGQDDDNTDADAASDSSTSNQETTTTADGAEDLGEETPGGGDGITVDQLPAETLLRFASNILLWTVGMLFFLVVVAEIGPSLAAYFIPATVCDKDGHVFKDPVLVTRVYEMGGAVFDFAKTTVPAVIFSVLGYYFGTRGKNSK